MTIHRLDKPDAPPMSDEQVAALTAEIAVDGVPQVYWFYKMAHGSPNNIDQIKPSGINGGLVTQRGASGYAILADDEAMVLTMAPSDAAYYSVVAYNNWFITHDYANHTVSLNNSQVKRNANGTVTFVIAPKDPGVHNWVDTAGENHVLLVIRAQGLSMRPAHEPTIHTRVVKVGDLRSMLPSETVWVTPEQRAAQIGERQRQIAARMADH